MKNTIKPLFSLLLFFVSLSSWAQHSFTVKGRVFDDNKKGLNNLTVMLEYKNGGDTLYRLTDNKGLFVFSNVLSKEVNLYITGVGYERFSKQFVIEKPVLELDSIVLVHSAKVLSEVIVKANNAIIIKDDTISYKADSFATRPNDMAEDLLKKLPGVEVDKDGNVTAHGKQVTKVKINGKDLFGDDVKAATKEIPVELIDKIQVIDDYGDQAAFTGIRDGDPQKILNIQLKSDKNKGVFANTSAGLGTEERYKASASVQYFNNDLQLSLLTNANNINESVFNFGNPALSGGGNRRGGGMMGGGMGGMAGGQQSGGTGMMSGVSGGQQMSGGQMGNNGINDTKAIGFNYRDEWGKKITVYGGLVLTSRNSNTITNTSQQNLFSNSSNLITQDTYDTTKGINKRFTFNLEYKPDSNNYIKFSPQITFRNTKTSSVTNFDTESGTQGKTNYGFSTLLSDSKSPTYSGSLLYNHRFGKKGRTMSLNFTGSSSLTNQDDEIENNSSYITAGGVATTVQYQDIKQENQNYSYGLKASYTEPLSLKNNLEFNYSYNKQFTGNDKKTYDIDQATNSSQYVDSLSNVYDNDYTTHRFGTNFRHTEKKFQYTVGVAVQPVL
ncbi:MAG: TonB-dependent receptor [Chitinophagaceae bacterium]|nr:TonB-dependent receptor [Chitinophagaceae bacterium]